MAKKAGDTLNEKIKNSNPEPSALGLSFPFDPQVLDEYPDSMTVGELRKKLKDGCITGIQCGGCGQDVKVYSRPLNENIAIFVESLCREWAKTSQPVHHTKTVYKSRDYAYAEDFGLARTFKAAPGSNKKMSGSWEPTQRGIDWVYGGALVEEYLIVYNGTVLGRAKNGISYQAALGIQHSHASIMGTNGAASATP